MKKVVVHPERCLGCMQCMIACATAHSQTQNLFTAICENPLPKPRVHVGAGLYGDGFPNRCRHCDPSPCMMACLSGAISRDPETDTVLINPDRCINCASCAMACPFGVIRYHEDHTAPLGKTIAVKCDNCRERGEQGKIPACAEVCKSGGLTFEELGDAMKRKTDEVARSMSPDGSEMPLSSGFAMLNTVKQAQMAMN
ncbi:MAG: 4Fe-4S ferredoxin [Desulfobacteraceae bacterium 4572_88]|nr:MAG: 4Fe-4S ferredoxin [Desulfobacteraceae bacterium 4572_88]